MRKTVCTLLTILLVCILLSGCSSEDSRRPQEMYKVSVSIRCDTAVANGMHLEEKWKGIIPEDGCILPETDMEVKPDETVFDVLCQVRDDYGIHMEYSGGKKMQYIEGIGNLYERDGGRWSGWMYSVNGEYPELGCGQYELKDGDRIEWNYTCDLGLDLEAGMKGAKEWKETHE